jgi:hypothetical protein
MPPFGLTGARPRKSPSSRGNCCCEAADFPEQKGMFQSANSTRRVVVEPGGTGVVAHVGLHALGCFADRLGLGDSLLSRLPWRGGGFPIHDRGKVLVQCALVLAGGGESCLDIEHLRIGDYLFGSVPSDTTLGRTFHELTPSSRAGIAEVMAEVRAEVVPFVGYDRNRFGDLGHRRFSGRDPLGEQRAGGIDVKGGFGFHPMFCFSDSTCETLSALLRPGNAGSNTVADHICVLDGAVAQLPADIACGHRVGDDPELIKRAVVMRADSAGCTEDFLKACRARNVGFTSRPVPTPRVTAAIFDAIGLEEVWLPALDQDGEPKDGAAVVVEFTSLIDAAKFPTGARLIVRREPFHPRAQRSLFPSLDFRYWGFYTDQDGDPRDLDVTMRAHAHGEQHIARLKDSGLMRFPFTSFEANTNWLMTGALAADLVRWFQLLCFAWKDARPKALRWGIFHAPGRLVLRARRRVVRIVDGWPSTRALLDAYQRIELIT